MKTFPVVMVLKDGTTYIEEDYEGYGVFGGMDFFVAMGDMNGLREKGDSDDEVRSKAIDIYYDNPSAETPNLFEYFDDGEYQWTSGRPQDCPDQGYFYS